MDGQLAPPLRIELYSRTILHEQARQRRDKVVGRLEELAGTDRVEEVETITWRKRVPVEEDCFECYHYDLFDTWATEAGVSLEPFFSTRRCWEPETEGRGKHMIMPVLGLAVYSGEHLRTVYPHSTAEGGRSVMDALRVLESACTRTAAVKRTSDIDVVGKSD